MKPHALNQVKSGADHSWESFSSLADLQRIEADWHELHKAVGGSVFTHFNWLAEALQKFPLSGELHILCVRRNGALVAAAVFNTEVTGISKRLPRFKRKVAKHYQSLYDGFFEPLFTDDAAMESLVSYFIDQFNKNIVVMPLIREGAFQMALVAHLEKTHRVWLKTKFECAEVSTEQGWDAYQASRSRNFSRSVAKSVRRFEKAGGAVEIYQSLTADRMERVASICKKSWKHTTGTGIFAESQRRTFFEDISATFSDKNELLVLILTVDGQDVSFAIYVECNGVYHGVWSDFDEEFEKLSPGRIAIFSGLERAFATPKIQIIDMMRRTHFLRPFETNFYSVFSLKAAPKMSLSRFVIGGEAFVAKKLAALKSKKSGSVRRADVKKGQS